MSLPAHRRPLGLGLEARNRCRRLTADRCPRGAGDIRGAIRGAAPPERRSRPRRDGRARRPLGSGRRTRRWGHLVWHAQPLPHELLLDELAVPPDGREQPVVAVTGLKRDLERHGTPEDELGALLIIRTLVCESRRPAHAPRARTAGGLRSDGDLVADGEHDRVHLIQTEASGAPDLAGNRRVGAIPAHDEDIEANVLDFGVEEDSEVRLGSRHCDDLFYVLLDSGRLRS
jgi:hypothetical protein